MHQHHRKIAEKRRKLTSRFTLERPPPHADRRAGPEDPAAVNVSHQPVFAGMVTARQSPADNPSFSAFRITVGNAASSAGVTFRNHPTGGANPAGTDAVSIDRIRWKWVKVCRTSSPRRRQSAANGGPRRRRALAPVPARQPEHAAEQPALPAASRPAPPRPRAAPARRSPAAPASPASRPAAAARRRSRPAPGAGGRARGRCRRPAPAACRSSPRGPSPPARSRPAAPRGVSRAARARSARLRRRQRRLDGEEPRHHPLDVAVHHHRRPVEGDRGDRRGGIGADPRQRPQARLGVGKPAAVRAATARAQASRLRARA